MATSALMTELEAVNIILGAAEEAPVSSLSLSGLAPLEKAKASLLEANRVIQSAGWKFNSEDEYPLSRSVDGTITLPENMIRVKVDSSFTQVDPVQRGARLYDSKNHSYSFDQDLTASVVFFLEWDELPQPARHLIAIKGARIMQGRTSVSDSTYKFTESDELSARLAFADHEAEVGDYNVLRDSWSAGNIILERYDVL